GATRAQNSSDTSHDLTAIFTSHVTECKYSIIFLDFIFYLGISSYYPGWASSSEMGGGGSYIDPTTDREQPSIHFRHNDQANIGFFDGHSEGMSAGESRQTSNGVKKYFTSSGQKIILNSLY
ncbi:MAG TPA: hypothetical protein K8W19_12635, partial [Victivallis vadensis]|nr:hypothetical protein [Victivallis vadensis]